jgi:hypothetical protein
VFTPSYHHVLPSYHCCFAIIQSLFHVRIIVFSPSYHRVSLPSRFYHCTTECRASGLANQISWIRGIKIYSSNVGFRFKNLYKNICKPIYDEVKRRTSILKQNLPWKDMWQIIHNKWHETNVLSCPLKKHETNVLFCPLKNLIGAHLSHKWVFWSRHLRSHLSHVGQMRTHRSYVRQMCSETNVLLQSCVSYYGPSFKKLVFSLKNCHFLWHYIFTLCPSIVCRILNITYLLCVNSKHVLFYIHKNTV